MIRTARASLPFFICFAFACAHAKGIESRAAESPRIATEQRTAQLRAKLAATPKVAPLHAQLALALLDKARETHDPAVVGQAREAAQASLALGETFEGDRAMMLIQNYSHRFEDAIRFAWKAADASNNGRSPMDPEIVSELVEAHLGLGQPDEARKVLGDQAEHPRYFYYAAASAQWLNQIGRHEDASRRLLEAAQLAQKEGSASLRGWAEVAAAGALLDGGKAAEAKPLLAKAAVDAAGTVALYIHEAELAGAEGRFGDALASYEAALAKDADPELERMAFAAAHKAGSPHAQQHFDAAEKGFESAIAAGEVYSLGALAQLYADAGVRLERARELSELNLRYKRDTAAQATYAVLHPRTARQ